MSFTISFQNDENAVLPISELFDMAAKPVRKLLNPELFDGEENEIDLSSIARNEKRPFSLKDLMVLNQRSMLVAKTDDDVENVLVITGTIIPSSEK